MTAILPPGGRRLSAARLLALLLVTACAGVLRADVYLSSYNFDVNSRPTIYADDVPAAPYRLRAKIATPSGDFHAATSYNNNNLQLDALPPPGTYGIDLYWVRYDPNDWNAVLEVEP